MRASRGFTLVEAMIGMVILAVIVAGALSFFIMWSSRSTETFRYKTADESAATAINLLTTDIRKAGFGLSKNPDYAIFVVNNGGAAADELYLSYGDYLNLEGDIRAPTTDTHSVPYRSVNSVFMPNRRFTVDSMDIGYQGKTTLSATTDFQLLAIPKVQGATHYPGIGAVICNGSSVADVSINGTAPVAGKIPGTQDWTFPVDSSGRNATGGSVAPAAGMTVSPAISYKVFKDPALNTGGLWRNRGAEASPFGAAILGGTPYLDVTNFQVEIQNADLTWVTTNTQPAKVRLIKVTISYKVMLSRSFKSNAGGQYTGWTTSAVQRQFTVCPRSVAFAQ